MSGFRVPGPICAARQPWALDEGTRALWWMPAPRVTGGAGFLSDLTAPPPASCPVVPPDVGWLFDRCSAPESGLTRQDYESAAAALGVEVAAIQAVAEVETSGDAFDDVGRPRILYERHHFHRLTGGRYSASHPDISNPVRGGYGRFAAQYGKLERAYRLDGWAALQSASWGRFQIMGSHYARLGFGSPHEMVGAMAASERAHLDAFVRFVQSDASLLSALRRRDWARFARGYNGPAYRDNAYDTRMEQAYQRFAASPASAAGSDATQPPPGAAPPGLSPLNLRPD